MDNCDVVGMMGIDVGVYRVLISIGGGWVAGPPYGPLAVAAAFPPYSVCCRLLRGLCLSTTA